MTSPNFTEPAPSSTCQVPQPSPTEINVCCEDRWQVYHRLQELDIACQCKGFQPLKVTIQTPTDAIQLWNIVRRVSKSRQELAAALNQSWQLPCAQ